MALLVGELRAVLDLDSSKYDKGLDRSHDKFGKFVKGAAVASAALAVAAGAGLLNLAKGAAEDEKAQAVLAKTLKNTAGATNAQVASIEAYITKTGAATGVTDDQMRPALANLVRATHDVGKAQSLMGLAMDVSAGTGKDLGAVTMALAKAQNGSVGGLAKLGIATKDASGKTKSFEQIQKDLAKTFTGQSAAAAETTSGKYARLKLIMAEAGESIGAKVLPVLLALGTFLLNKVVPAVFEFGTRVQVKLMPALREFGKFVKDEVVPRLKDLGGFITGTLVPGLESMGKFIVKNKDFFIPFAATLGVILAAVKAWTIAQAALNIVLTANPLGLLVVGLAAAVAGLIYAYRHSERFREIVDRVGVAAGITFVTIGRGVLALVRVVMPALKFMAIGFLDFVGGILAAAAKVDNALGGHLGLQKASDSFNKFKDVARTSFDAAMKKAGQWDKSLAATQKTLILKANIQDLESKLKTAKAGLADKNLTKERRAQLVATITDLTNKIRTAKGQLAQPALVATKIAKLQADKRVLDDRIAAAKRALANPQLTATKKAKLTAEIAQLQSNVAAAQRVINTLKGKTVSVEIKYTSGGVNLTTPSRVGGKALGGAIHGPGGPTDDRAGLYALSDDEHVWTAKEVHAAGGHAAVERMRKAVLRRGGGLAAGGRPGSTIQSTFDAAAARGAQRYAAMFAGAAPSGGGGLGRWATTALLALRLTGSPASWLGSLLRRMNQESGGNPRAINLWDSNAKRGTPSMGLMQTILPTFNAYAGSYRKYGPWNPLANIIASINYANARYGSAPRGWDRPGGYRHGGWLMPGRLAYNETRRPERILNDRQWNALARGGGGDIHVHLDGAIIASQQEALDWLTKGIDKLKRLRRI